MSKTILRQRYLALLAGIMGASAIAGGALRGLAIAAGIVTVFGATPAAAQCFSGTGGTLLMPACNITAATGVASTAVGLSANATGTNATAYGNAAVANGDFATATGHASAANGDLATATGRGSTANGDNATATGQRSNANGFNATAMGQGSTASGATASAFGQGSTANGDATTAIGQASIANATGATAIGQGTTASGASAFAGGIAATAKGASAVALGANASALAANSVAIGAGSLANAPNTVSFGSPGNERRLTNVAAGIDPTDAVNVSQLSSLSAGFQSQIGGLQSQINNVDRRLRDGVAVSMAAGGVPAVPQGRKVGVFGNIATYDGHGAAGVGLTGVVYETRGYQVQANGSVGVGFDTSVVGGRGGVAVFW